MKLVILSLVLMAAGVVLMVIGDRKNRKSIGSGQIFVNLGYGMFAAVLIAWATYGKLSHRYGY